MKLHVYEAKYLLYRWFSVSLFLSTLSLFFLYIPSSPGYFFVALLYQCFVMLQKSKECEVKFSITYLNRNARELSQTKATKNKNYRKDDSLINNRPTKKSNNNRISCIWFGRQGISADSLMDLNCKIQGKNNSFFALISLNFLLSKWKYVIHWLQLQFY